MNSTSDSGESVKTVIPVVVGPTGIGKTEAALGLAEQLNLEIVSCDSRQIYKYMEIGTAKPNQNELGNNVYHLIDYVEPSEVYSAAKYRTDAVTVLDQIVSRGNLPLVVGGTGLYLRALTRGFFITPEPDYDYRRQLESLANDELYNKLSTIDLDAAKAISVKNRVRLVRALEIHHLTGQTKTALSCTGDYPTNMYSFRIFELSRSREKLYQFINFRVDKMIRAGLFDEVSGLLSQGYGNSPVLARTVGYREVLEHFSGHLSRAQCIELIKQRTRNYAKRQLTWFRAEPHVTRIDLESVSWQEKLKVEIDKFKLDT